MSWKKGICVCILVVSLVVVAAAVFVAVYLLGVFDSGGSSVCYDELGCFNRTGPFVDLPLPKSPEDVGIEFLLYTPEDIEKGHVISTKNIPSVWRDDRRTVFVVHGFKSYPTKWYNAELRLAFLEFQLNYQVITVDWEKGARLLQKKSYKQAASNSRTVGALIAQLLTNLSEARGYPMSRVHCIGHSLGAHACGYTGKILTGNLTMGRITGLDAAGPYFTDFPEDARLNPTDATFVDAIHTHTADFVTSAAASVAGSLTGLDKDGGFGIDIPVGHVDFVANGAGLQPGCFFKRRKRSSSSSKLRGCSHERAMEYMTESIRSSCVFRADPCPNMEVANEGECRPCREDLRTCQQVGLEAEHLPGRGVYLFKTTKKSPYC